MEINTMRIITLNQISKTRNGSDNNYIEGVSLPSTKMLKILKIYGFSHVIFEPILFNEDKFGLMGVTAYSVTSTAEDAFYKCENEWKKMVSDLSTYQNPVLIKLF